MFKQDFSGLDQNSHLQPLNPQVAVEETPEDIDRKFFVVNENESDFMKMLKYSTQCLILMRDYVRCKIDYDEYVSKSKQAEAQMKKYHKLVYPELYG
jgi:hypothetical protein